MDAFDKHFKTVFEDHEVPVNTESLWQKVEPALKKRRVPYGLILLILFVFFVGTFSVTSMLDTEDYKNESAISDSVNNSFFGRKGQLFNNISSRDTKTESELNLNSIETESSKTGTRAHANKKNAIEKHKIKSKFFPNDLVKENDVKAESYVKKEDSGDFEYYQPRILHSTQKVATNTVIQPVISLYSPKLEMQKKIKINWKHFNHSFDFYTGVDFVSKELLSKRYDYRWYKDERFATEQFLESFNFGINYTASHRSGFLFGAGLNFLQINEQFESTGDTEIRIFKEGIVEVITNADGSSTEITGQKLVLKQQSWDKKKYNNYQFINLPVYLGYAFSHKNIKYEISSGIDLNLVFQKSGEILGKEGFPVSLSGPNDSIFRNYTSINLNGGIKLLYPLSKRISIFAEPNFHMNLYSLTVDEYPLRQKYFHGGLRIGGRIIL